MGKKTIGLTLAVLFIFCAAPVLSQTIVNPRTVEFDPSADHSAVSSGGQPLVVRYDLSIYPAGGTQAQYVVDLGKPAPDSTGKIRLDFAARMPTWPLPNGTYVARVAAVGASGLGQSDPSNQFTFQSCSFAVTPTARSVGAAGGTTTVTVTADAGCDWTAASNVGWVTASPASGSGAGTVSLTITPNPGSTLRSGTVTIAGQTVTVTQDTVACPYSLGIDRAVNDRGRRERHGQPDHNRRLRLDGRERGELGDGDPAERQRRGDGELHGGGESDDDGPHGDADHRRPDVYDHPAGCDLHVQPGECVAERGGGRRQWHRQRDGARRLQLDGGEWGDLGDGDPAERERRGDGELHRGRECVDHGADRDADHRGPDVHDQPAGCGVYVQPWGVRRRTWRRPAGSGTVSVTAPGGCSWTAASGATWVTVTPPSGSGAGDGELHGGRECIDHGAECDADHRGPDVHDQPAGCGVYVQPGERVAERGGGRRQRHGQRDRAGRLRLDGGERGDLGDGDAAERQRRGRR